MIPFISFLLFLHVPFASPTSSAIEPICKAVAQAQPDITNECCTSLLNDAHLQDAKSLATFAATRAYFHSEATESRMKDLSSVDEDRGAQKRLHECEDAYGDSSDLIKDAVDAILHDQYAKAARLLRSSHGARSRCTEAFSDVQGVQFPLYESDDQYEKLAKLAEAIVNTLH